MLISTLNSLVLSASVAVLLIFTTAAPATPRLDPCGILGAKQFIPNAVTYKDVADCYEAIPYNHANAAKTLSTIYTIFNEFYIFRDAALTPDLPAPFSSPPTDIVERLKTILTTEYTRDFQFHDYIRSQKYPDCRVLTIEGVDALTYIKAWADEEVNFSRDAGVRLNHALSTQSYDPKTNTFVESPSPFSVRTNLPDMESLQYEIQCGQTEPIFLDEEWAIYVANTAPFKDVNSFIHNVCVTEPRAGELTEPARHQTQFTFQAPSTEDAALTSFSDGPASGKLPQQFPGAELITTGKESAFYHLSSQPDVGVIVISSFRADPRLELPNYINALKSFHTRGVTKLVIDLQGNPGGFIKLAANTIQTFFPSNESISTSLASDLRVTPVIQQVAEASFRKTHSLYDASCFIDFDNKNQPYANNSLFLSLASNIRILTDGRCGSACAIVAHFLSNVHKVDAYAVGGTKAYQLSMFSFPGGIVSNRTVLSRYYADAGLASPLEPFTYSTHLGVTVLEIYAHGSATPLEYDAALYPAAYRVGYTTQNSRNRQVMWEAVAPHAWKRNNTVIEYDDF
ncbi:hypothetical protein EC957_000493 [Mortierella hygrophila]|uniref:Tail specific protease domain-containing protein n=1 Tax=Mortierella hygrophila TaxID=979708 RepID=A0A9P6F7N6_9FUNG|nr:hypothetical protein EC957_000493 [Mortierella hygrophila]